MNEPKAFKMAAVTSGGHIALRLCGAVHYRFGGVVQCTADSATGCGAVPVTLAAVTRHNHYKPGCLLWS